jgi:hypothetical protein
MGHAFFINIGRSRYGLKSPGYPVLFSERYRRSCRVIPLLFGWRVTVRRRSDGATR